MFNSFVAGIVSFKALPRPQFATLQSKLFPIYFAMQTALPVAMAATYPGGPLTPSSISGVLDSRNQYSVLTPIATIFVCAVANMVVIGPATTKCMKERKHQETRDGKKSYDAGPHSAEMQALNKRFGKLHGASSLANIIACIATVVYGVHLGNRL